MQLKSDTQTGLGAEIAIIPLWAWVLAALALAGSQLAIGLLMGGLSAPPVLARILLGFAAGTVLAGYLLLIGYMSRDAGRRQMNTALWLLVAILIPNGFGILLYFILRQPLLVACPQCGNRVRAGFNYCPNCSYQVSSSCPHCHRPVAGEHLFCPHCGGSLPNRALTM